MLTPLYSTLRFKGGRKVSSPARLHKGSRKMFLRLNITAAVVPFAFGTLFLTPAYRAFKIEEEIIASLQSSDYFPIILWLPGSEDALPSPWTAQLPFLVKMWTAFDTANILELRDHHAFNRKVMVVVPFSSRAQRIEIQERLQVGIRYVPMVRLLFILNSSDGVSLDIIEPLSCALIFVNETTIDVPQDSYRNCTKRSTVGVQELFAVGTKKSWGNMKGKSLVVTTHLESNILGNFHYKQISYAPALLDAYTQLNVTYTPFTSSYNEKAMDGYGTVLIDILLKKSDLSVLPYPMAEHFWRIVDIHSYVHTTRFVFETGKKKRQPPSLRFGYGHLHAALGVFVGVLLIVCLYNIQGSLGRRPRSNWSMIVFLYATILGRGTAFPLSSEHSVVRMLLGIWLLMALVLCTYIQSELTSQASVPPVTKPIDTIEQLEERLHSGLLLPCVNEGLFAQAYILLSDEGILGTVNDLMSTCGESCTEEYNKDACLKKVRRGTHFFLIFDMREGDTKASVLPGLHQGKEYLGVVQMAMLVSKAFPYLREHLQLLSRIRETGIHVPIMRKMNYTNPDRDTDAGYTGTDAAVVFTFSHILAYAYGCFASLLTLLIECAVKAFHRT